MELDFQQLVFLSVFVINLNQHVIEIVQRAMPYVSLEIEVSKHSSFLPGTCTIVAQPSIMLQLTAGLRDFCLQNWFIG